MVSEQFHFTGEKNYIHLLSTVSQKKFKGMGLSALPPTPHILAGNLSAIISQPLSLRKLLLEHVLIF